MFQPSHTVILIFQSLESVSTGSLNKMLGLFKIQNTKRLPSFQLKHKFNLLVHWDLAGHLALLDSYATMLNDNINKYNCFHISL